MTSPNDEIVIFQSLDGDVQLDVRLEEQTVWLSLAQISALFGWDKSVISRHFRNIYESGELGREATVAKNATVQFEGDHKVVRSYGDQVGTPRLNMDSK